MFSKKDLKGFTNFGLVTVHTVSGKETIVDTATQSYLDATSAPTISQLLSSIVDAENAVPTLLKTNLGAAAAAGVVGGLNSMQSSTAKVGRGFKIDLMPRSLPNASSAELEVNLNVEETAEPTLYSGAKSLDENFSRVAKHNTTTKIRVDSLRIFEVSSLYAQLERSRAPFPILPIPGLEVPYIGSFVGFPRSPASEYHSSIAILSAIVVPTAADLGYTARFEWDRISRSQATRTMKDLGDEVPPFHRLMVSCFRSGDADCASKTFLDVLPEPR